MNYSNKKGFTLIELLIVISVISLLSTIVMYSTSEAKLKANDAHMKVESDQVAKAIQLYKDDNGGKAPYPVEATYSQYKGQMINENDPELDKKIAYQESMQILVDEGYLPEIPTSPDGSSYSYLVTEDGEDTVFAASLNLGSSNTNNSCSTVQVNWGSCTGYTSGLTEDEFIPEGEYTGDLESLPTCETGFFAGAFINKPCRDSGYVVVDGTPDSCENGVVYDEETQFCFDVDMDIFNSNCSINNYECTAETKMSSFPDYICSSSVSLGGFSGDVCMTTPRSYYVCNYSGSLPICSGGSNSDYCNCI